MSEKQDILLGFDSIHDVLRAEKILRRQGIPSDMVPTPRELSSDCGMSMKGAAEHRSRLLEIDSREGLLIRSILSR